MAETRRDPALDDPEIELLTPAQDVDDPELSIVVPALNEELTIGAFVAWCQEGLEKAEVRGEILIIDSSSDGTGEIALRSGARVLKTPRRGLGRAYLDAVPFIRGKYVLMGDADLTYDFRRLAPFVERFREGYEYIMGSRFAGYIEPGAMPPLHRYFGTPVTTFILNLVYASRFSDIHCGMRGISLDALARMDLRSQSWEYASEMVVKSVQMKLKTTEVPIHFLKEGEGRVSHHRREGWFSPWKAAWMNMRAVFVNGAQFFLFKPGLLLLFLGLILLVPLSWGELRIGPLTFSMFWMLLGLALSIVGLQSVYLGILSKVMFDYTGEATARWTRVFAYNRSVVLSAVAFVVGFVLGVNFVRSWIALDFKLGANLPHSAYLAIAGLFLMVSAFMNFTFTLHLFGIVAMKAPTKSDERAEPLD